MSGPCVARLQAATTGSESSSDTDITNPFAEGSAGSDEDAHIPQPGAVTLVGAESAVLPTRPPRRGSNEVVEDEVPRFQSGPRVGQAIATTSTPCSQQTFSTVPRSLSEASTAASLGADEVGRGRAAATEEVRKHAHTPADFAILSRFLDLQLLDGHNDLAIDPPKRLLRLALRAMKLLHLCDFQHEDVCRILAHSSICFRATYRACGHQMSGDEAANAVVAQMFIAHSYFEDETCPLWVWHDHIFQNYCSLKTLNEAILKLLAIRAYSLRVDRKEMMKRYEYLCGYTT